MVVALQSMYYMILIFFHLLNNTSIMSAHTGRRAAKSRNEIVSNAQEHSALSWPKGVVTYYLDNNSYDYIIAQRVRMAMNTLETVSCVRFKPTLIKPSGNMTWIHFTNMQGKRECVHEPKFNQEGEIVLVIGLDCLKEHEILHTLLHAIGFKDEVTHPQRDQYIRVMWNNIQPEYRHLYRIQSSNEKSSELLVEYDPLSIMHFHDRAFSINGQATVMPLVPGLLISPSNDLSQLDKMRLRLLFDHECNKRKVGDMIDTCKLVLSDNNRPQNPETITESSFDKNNNKADEADYVDKPDENEIVDTIDEPDKNEIIDTINEVDKVNGVENGNKTDENVEVDEEHTDLHVESIENQYDLNEHHPDTVLNRETPEELMDQQEELEGKEKTDEGDEKLEYDEQNETELKSAEKQDDLNENQTDTSVKLLGGQCKKKDVSESISGQDYDQLGH